MLLFRFHCEFILTKLTQLSQTSVTFALMIVPPLLALQIICTTVFVGYTCAFYKQT